MGTAALEDAKFNQLTSLRTNMSGIYNRARICPYDKQNCNLATEGWTLDPDIELKLASSNDYDEMKYIWVCKAIFLVQFCILIEYNLTLGTMA